jgi:hypothetical protein
MTPHVDGMMRELRAPGYEGLPGEIKSVAQRMGEVFRGSLDKEFASVTQAIATLFGGGPEASRLATVLPGTLLTLQYMSSMAFRVGLPFRNLFQPLITGSPFIGVKATMQGYNDAMRIIRKKNPLFESAYTGKVGLQEMKELGQWPEFVPVPMAGVIEDGAMAGGFIGSLHRWARRGLAMQAHTDKFNRMTMFFGAIRHAEEKLQIDLAGKKGWEWFAREADLNMFHVVDRDAWKVMYEKASTADGSWRELILNFAKRVSDESQYIYASFANPRIYHSSLVKMGFQYGVFPLNYLDNIKERGFFNSVAKTRYWRRLFGVHGSVLGVGTALGIPVGDWVFFNPLDYGGGPFLQFTSEMLNAKNGPEKGKAERMASVAGRMAIQIIPLAGLWRTDIKKSLKYLEGGHGLSAMMSMFRLADWPEEDYGLNTGLLGSGGSDLGGGSSLGSGGSSLGSGGSTLK